MRLIRSLTPCLALATLLLAASANSGKGAVWINGHPIGRYWNIGPQATLYAPGPWLRAGKNEIVVLDLFARTHLPRLAGLSAPILNEPMK